MTKKKKKMGRPRKRKAEVLQPAIGVRLTDAERKAFVKRVAYVNDHLGKSYTPTEYVRELIRVELLVAQTT